MTPVSRTMLSSGSVCAVPRCDRHGGFSLVENLVALFILTLGLLALAGLQLETIRSQHTSHQQAAAQVLAQELADRMRANLDGARAGAYVLPDNPPDAAQADCLLPQGCTSLQMALNDLWEWQQEIESRLPNGLGFVCLDSTPSRNRDDFVGSDPGVLSSRCDGLGTNYMIHVLWDRGRRPDGRLELTTDPLTSDGHFFMAFEP